MSHSIEIINDVARAEARLADIWSDLLEIEEVDGEDNFFDLGGDSLQAVEMVFRAREAGIHMEVRHLFTSENLTELAAKVGSNSRP
ncbi:phosphopantetheine-binding protein [Sphaerisporangium sp. TRM90804]|uniref:phosphopantetheine-binding protein n=1 Tax=Sphaerisporangium sp. TRM90804 TaxID=3031113 RepID=UPI00244A9E50|nr:phosphopantetheine-binding protein [Sphaerisporangium sp. TRM90804]MDH2424608.1 phosphopantetheine-binding protein [Sphaerisporangium sp. TRM90804]